MTSNPTPNRVPLLCGLAIIVIVGVAAAATRQEWLPLAGIEVPSSASSNNGHGHDHGAHGHSHGDDGHNHGGDDGHNHGADDGHNHGSEPSGSSKLTPHAGHDDATAIELSAAAWKNVGLQTTVVKPSTFVRTVSAPGMVVERPGHSQFDIPAPLTGVVTRVCVTEGQAVAPNQPLFELRLTHEDLVIAQREFLLAAEELDVINDEITRLTQVGDGVIAGRRKLEYEYDARKTRAALRARRQGLLLHGISNEQIDQILATRQLLQTLIAHAPAADQDTPEPNFHVQKIVARRGQHVTAGDALATIADHRLLYVEGQAFEEDAQSLLGAASRDWSLSITTFDQGGGRGSTHLELLNVADHVDEESRALHFYLKLPNEKVAENSQSSAFVAWRFRPGQRLEVSIPVSAPEPNQIVAPLDAVVEEGAEAFVFEQNGDHFDRVPVHIIHRTKEVVVLENDGKLIGKTIAATGAYQLYLALKNRGNDNTAHGHVH